MLTLDSGWHRRVRLPVSEERLPRRKGHHDRVDSQDSTGPRAVREGSG